MKLVQFNLEEATFNRMKTIAVIEGKTITDFITSLIVEKLKQYPDDERLEKYLKIPIEERLHRVLGQQIEEFVDKRGTIVKTAKHQKKSVSKKK